MRLLSSFPQLGSLLKRLLRSPRRLVLFCGLLIFFMTFLPVLLLRWIAPSTSAVMVEKSVAGYWSHPKTFQLHYHWVPLKRISSNAALAVIASEDQKFFEHFGFDVESIRDAWDDFQEGRRLRGASTISQQVAKNLFLWTGRSFVRKGLEAYFTLLIEITWPKRRILEVYLNIAQFGKSVFGVDQASEIFFSKPPSKLTRRESARLAAVLPNPERFSAAKPSKYVNRRTRWIMRQMSNLGGTGYLKGL